MWAVRAAKEKALVEGRTIMGEGLMEQPNQGSTRTLSKRWEWLLLFPLSKLYELITTARNACYDTGIFPTHSAGIPVVCIGNLTAGGSGKTPLVLALARELIARGHQPVILSRGYGGRRRGPHRVSSEDDAEAVGDEPLLMARRGVCPVVIARDRVIGAQFISDARIGSVILLDDGMQHRRLGRVCNIATFFAGNDEAVDAIVEGALLPLGRFRENRDAGLRRADLIALCERGGRSADRCIERSRSVLPATIPSFLVGASVSRPLQAGQPLAAGSIIWIFCGIANPESFVESMLGGEYVVAGVTCFPDHHQLLDEERNVLIRNAKNHGATLVCTEKDWVKLSSPLKDDVGVVYLEAEVPAVLVDLVEQRIVRGVIR